MPPPRGTHGMKGLYAIGLRIKQPFDQFLDFACVGLDITNLSTKARVLWEEVGRECDFFSLGVSRAFR